MQQTDFIRSILPDHYTVVNKQKKIHCFSRIGIDENTNEWEEFKEKVRKFFGDSLSEFYHITCHNHVNFEIYIK